MFEIIFLGTSASAPSIHRGLTSQVIMAGEHRFLIDCGEGTQRQILRSGVGFKKLNHILLTHSHLDHILGLGGLASTFIRWENDIEELVIWGGKPALDRVQSLLFEVVFRNETPEVPIHLVDLKPGVFIETKQFTVTAIPVTHRGAGCFGYIFKEHDRHPFLAEQADALGIPAGPERAKLVRGESVTLADGRTISPDEVLGEQITGAKLAYIGDTARTDNLAAHIRDADTLVIEATFLESEADVANQFGHITARQAATLALENGVKTLILNHISRRYHERDVINEARSVFPNSYVARDMDHFAIRRGQTAEKVTNNGQ